MCGPQNYGHIIICIYFINLEELIITAQLVTLYQKNNHLQKQVVVIIKSIDLPRNGHSADF